MPNDLANETSPYLLQHAHNPVDWLPWGDEAFRVARESDRPVLLSVGYSACHWCHVMERESFDDEATAAFLNERFVAVKVDREERPDVDAVYMRAVQSMTGQGGWPLTVFLTPGSEPFYGGTYFPPEPRHGMPSFRQVLDAVSSAWRERRHEVAEGASRLVAALRASPGGPGEAGGGGDGGGRALVSGAVRGLLARADTAHGGFGGAPKFPQPTTLELLLRWDAVAGEPAAAAHFERTLDTMARGGIRDHLGGGFHRYTVDARWLVPHFEKMLYDNALLARLYLHGWQRTGHARWARVVEETLGWLLDDMRDPGGGFYAARDADSEGEEGRHYVWTPADLRAVLDEGDARLFARSYDVSEGGNWEGTSILHLPHPVASSAAREGMDPEAFEERLAALRGRLLEARARREPPLRDGKVLADWNGMALRTFAEAGGAMGRPDWVEAARAGASFVLDHMRRDGALLHVWTDGEARVPAFLADHAAVGNALLSLHEATLEARWAEEARGMCDAVLERFWTADDAVFHDTPAGGEALVIRPRETMDNATPSGTSLAVELLFRAGHLFDEPRYRDAARAALARGSDDAGRHPLAFGRLLSVAASALAEPLEVAVVGRPDDPATGALLGATLRPWHPARTVTGADPEADPDGGPILDVPLLRGRGLVDGKPAAYVCSGYACERPVTDVDELAALLAERTGALAP